MHSSITAAQSNLGEGRGGMRARRAESLGVPSHLACRATADSACRALHVHMQGARAIPSAARAELTRAWARPGPSRAQPRLDAGGPGFPRPVVRARCSRRRRNLQPGPAPRTSRRSSDELEAIYHNKTI